MGNFAMPDWQHGLITPANHGVADKRNSPDVAMVAQDVAVFFQGGPSAVGGTSASAPLWAAYTALINQRAADAGRPPVGFLNPSLYAIARAPGTSDVLHDIQSGDNRTPWNKQPDHDNQYLARPGFDMASGWGTPTGSKLIDLLALNGPLESKPALTALAAASNRDGRLEVLGLSSAGAVQHASQVVAGHTWGPWSSLAGHDLTQLTVAQNADRRLEVFALGGDGAAYHIWQATPNGTWTSWSSLAGHDLQAIAPTRNADGRLELFALGNDHAVYDIWQTSVGGGWSAWSVIR
jgi:hypothetical protein